MAWRATVLGVAQDGGMPQLGCVCSTCAAARRGDRPAALVACVGVDDGERLFLFDATPDLPRQAHHRALLRPGPDGDRAGPRLAGIFLTHAHIGHYTGLVHLGREAMGARALPVWATPGMQRFLRANAPWSALVELGHIDLRDTPEAGATVDLGNGLTVAGVRVPHRDEWAAGTVGYTVRGPRASLLFIPDIDRWEELPQTAGAGTSIRGLVDGVDVALLDATFFSAAELPGRDIRQVPHPLCIDTMDRLADVAAKVVLIHLNHSNALFHTPALAEDRGFRVAREGQAYDL